MYIKIQSPHHIVAWNNLQIQSKISKIATIWRSFAQAKYPYLFVGCAAHIYRLHEPLSWYRQNPSVILRAFLGLQEVSTEHARGGKECSVFGAAGPSNIFSAACPLSARTVGCRPICFHPCFWKLMLKGIAKKEVDQYTILYALPFKCSRQAFLQSLLNAILR